MFSGYKARTGIYLITHSCKISTSLCHLLIFAFEYETRIGLDYIFTHVSCYGNRHNLTVYYGNVGDCSIISLVQLLELWDMYFSGEITMMLQRS